MSEPTPQDKRPDAPQYTPDVTEPPVVPAGQVKPEAVATLAIEYRDGRPVIVATGGIFIPQKIRLAGSGFVYTSVLMTAEDLTNDVPLFVLPDDDDDDPEDRFVLGCGGFDI
ncbi:hypothetical protein [Streptomyces sp. NPDC127108]|uniref:hypothetical protein n=1 Tax=Streptomyces sp. NPDC127108 TaxID=3345361 RepID=UPI003633ED07